MMGSAVGASTGATPFFSMMEHANTMERSLCDLLEDIADALPETQNRLVVVPVIDMLRNTMGLHRALQEGFFLPLLKKRCSESDSAESLCAQIETEHTSDEALALDIAEQLEEAIGIGRFRNPNMLGYMLYAYFEGRRRHLAWEETVLFPLALDRLKPRDWKDFSPTVFIRKFGDMAKPVKPT